jgi:hypothetical protein
MLVGRMSALRQERPVDPSQLLTTLNSDITMIQFYVHLDAHH